MAKKNQNNPEAEAVEEAKTAEETTETEPEVEVINNPDEGASEQEPPTITLNAMSPEADQLLRLKAEYDNFRKRTAKEKIETKDETLRQTALEFLPVYDNLDRALKQHTEDETFKKGVEMTLNQLKTVFEKLELEKIPALGELFDPNLHEALQHVEDEKWGENTISEVYMEGFTYRGKVIRFAKVLVAN